MNNNDTIEKLQASLKTIIGDWEETSDVPSNWVRKTGMGDIACIVDRRCGGYQDVHKPLIIGWKASNGHMNPYESGIVCVGNTAQPNSIIKAINEAKELADRALERCLINATDK